MTSATSNAAPLADAAERERLRRELDVNFLVEAAAGTGKTTCLVTRMVALLAAGKCRTRNIAAVTFTHQAAAQLRTRFQQGLEKEAAAVADDATRRRLLVAAADISQAYIGTIHSFCARLIRERPVESGVDAGFTESDESQDGLLVETVWHDTIDELAERADPLLSRVTAFGINAADLRTSFINYFEKYPDIACWHDEPQAAPDVAPLRAVCENYASDLESLVKTFPPPQQRGNDELMYQLEDFVRGVRNCDWNDLGEVIALLENCKEKPRITHKNWPGVLVKRRNTRAEAANERWERFVVETASVFLDAARKAAYPPIIALYRHVAARVAERRRAAGFLNFQELLLRAAALLRLSPEIRAYFKRRYTHVLVDEFQDTDPIQAEVMMLLTGTDDGVADWRRCRPRPGSLFVVGDPKQSIYRFRRADISIYNEVKRLIRDAGGEVIRLTTNFRSDPQIIKWVNDTFTDKFPSHENDPYSPPYVRLTPAPEKGDEDGNVYTLTVPEEYSNQEEITTADALAISRYIVSELSREGSAAGDYLIVTYRRDRLASYARSLQEKRVPHVVVGGDTLNQTEELRALADVLLAAADPGNGVNLLGTLRGYPFGVSDAELYEFHRAGGRFTLLWDQPGGATSPAVELVAAAFKRLKEYARWTLYYPPAPTAELILHDLGLLPLAAAAPGGNERVGCLFKALEFLRPTTRETYGLNGFCQRLAELIATGNKDLWQDALPARPPRQGSVARVMNLHKAKGLEAPVVFLADPSGFTPHPPEFHVERTEKPTAYLAIRKEDGFHSKLVAYPPDWDKAAEEESKFAEAELVRLRYVAATRAGRTLVVSLRAKNAVKNPWKPFEETLASFPRLPEPAAVPTAEEEAPLGITADEIADATKAIATRWERVTRRSYEIQREKELALAGTPAPATAGEGKLFGTVVHNLLDVAARVADAPLTAIAETLLREEGADLGLAGLAAAAAENVLRSALWKRARAARRVLTEAPYWRPAGDDGASAIIAGVVDLAFEEDDGWVLVDYKTGKPADGDYSLLTEYYRPQVTAYAEAWVQGGANVKETGIVFITPEEAEYVPLTP